MRILITGGAGFIGSALAAHYVSEGHVVTIADRFSYAGKGKNLWEALPRVRLLVGDLATGDLAERCAASAPDVVLHLAAETHVDRAIAGPEGFVMTNILGTTRLLQAFAQRRWADRPGKIIVYSTDEVYGPTPEGTSFDEHAPYAPSNAYSASKVGVEAMAHAFFRTHRLPIVIVRPCNTYGPRQHPEKAIPRFVAQAMQAYPLTVYNEGAGSRDWLALPDHVEGIHCLVRAGLIGESYNMAAYEAHSDLDIAQRVLAVLRQESGSRISFVLGRPGHDHRYAMYSAKLRALGWEPRQFFEDYFAETVRWVRDHADWWDDDLVFLEGK